MSRPSANGGNGRDVGGRFAKCNPGGPGNPFARRVVRLRAKVVESLTEDDLPDIVKKLVERAKAGEPWAIRELLDRAIGKAKPAVDEAGYGKRLSRSSKSPTCIRKTRLAMGDDKRLRAVGEVAANAHLA